jgi:hypothetical protein
MDGRLVSVIFFDPLGEKFARYFFAPHCADFRKLLTNIRTVLRLFSSMPFLCFRDTCGLVGIVEEHIDRWHIASLGGGIPLARRSARTASESPFLIQRSDRKLRGTLRHAGRHYGTNSMHGDTGEQYEFEA